jgi:LPS sulfotransferase NodH
VAQAVSWAKAVQTGQWASFQPVQAEPAFDFDEIDGLYHVARVHDGARYRRLARL